MFGRQGQGPFLKVLKVSTVEKGKTSQQTMGHRRKQRSTTLHDPSFRHILHQGLYAPLIALGDGSLLLEWLDRVSIGLEVLKLFVLARNIRPTFSTSVLVKAPVS